MYFFSFSCNLAFIRTFPLLVNFNELLIKLKMICESLTLSPNKYSGILGSISILMLFLFLRAMVASEFLMVTKVSSKWKTLFSSVTLFSSILFKLKISFTSDNKYSAENFSDFKWLLFSSSLYSSLMISVIPITPYNGVLSSCVMVEMNCDFTFDAISAFSLAILSSSLISRSF